MNVIKGQGCSSNSNCNSEEEMMMELRRGPWTVEEDFKLINYIANHGEGRWNSLARFAGLKRTGKSCRLRWLNYLRPDVRRGNITLEEQLLILELHSRWGNRWSKIAQYLPGRTDNEIKNYWRTRVQKHAKQLKCDVNSKQFKDTMRYLWMPRLVERIQANNNNAAVTGFNAAPTAASTDQLSARFTNNIDHGNEQPLLMMHNTSSSPSSSPSQVNANYIQENSSTATGASSDSFGTHVSAPAVSDLVDYCVPAIPVNNNPNTNPDYYLYGQAPGFSSDFSSSLISPTGTYFNPGIDFQAALDANNFQLMDGGDASDCLWNINVDDFWSLQQQFSTNM